jgi:hypothetical protein
MAKKLINNSGTTVGDIYDASIYNNTKATKKSYSRSDAFPIENSMIFYSLEDAQKYAKGDENDPDLRELYSLAYQGQIISVITGQKTIETTGTTGSTESSTETYDVIKQYYIDGNNELVEIGGDITTIDNDTINNLFK